MQNIKEMLTGGTREVTVAFGIPRPLAEGDDRKAITKAAEADVRRVLVALNRGQPLPELTQAASARPRTHAELVALRVAEDGEAAVSSNQKLAPRAISRATSAARSGVVEVEVNAVALQSRSVRAADSR